MIPINAFFDTEPIELDEEELTLEELVGNDTGWTDGAGDSIGFWDAGSRDDDGSTDALEVGTFNGLTIGVEDGW